MNDEQIKTEQPEQPKPYYGIDVYRRYEAKVFDFDKPTLTPTNIEQTWRTKHGWVPPSEQKRAA